MNRLRTFVRGFLSMRPFIGREVPTPEGDVYSHLDNTLWGIGWVHSSAAGGHFNATWLQVGTFKVGFRDSN